MELVFASEEVERQCRDFDVAKKLFGGDRKIAEKLITRIRFLEQAPILKSVVRMPSFRFHKLSNKHGRDLEGYFAMDIAGKRCPWRLIVQPLDEDGAPFVSCGIHEVAGIVSVIGIMEVSKHYE